MDDQLKLAFEYASDLAKQLITLSTGVLAVSITFTKDILGGVPPRGVTALKVAWVLLLLSTLAGAWTLAALAGSLAPIDGGGVAAIGWNVRYPAMAQELLFAAGVVFITGFGLAALKR